MLTITKLEGKTYQGKPSGFVVTLSDGTTGNLEEKQSDKGLRVGDPVAYTPIPYTSKAGKTSTLIGLRLVQGGQVGSQAGGQVSPNITVGKPQLLSAAPVGNLKSQTRAKVPFTAMEKIIDLVIAGKITWQQIKESHLELCNILYDEIENRTFTD
jgi:hypothetical protein